MNSKRSIPRALAALFIVVLGLVALALPVLAQDWAGRGRLQGLVTDTDRKPIDGAKVTLTLDGKGPEPLLTDKKGRWSKLGLATGTWTITIEAAGFNTAEGQGKVISEGVGPGETIRVSLNKLVEQKAAPTENKGPDVKGMIERANAALMESRWADARASYEEAMTYIKDPVVQASIHRSIGSTYFGEGKPDDAVAELEKSLALVPDDQDSLKLITTILSVAGKDEQAAVYRAKIVGEFKLDPTTLLNRGIEQYNKANYDGALQYFNQVVSENPTYADAYYYRGLAFLATGKSPEAKADFQKLLEIAPTHPKAADVKEFLAAL